MLGCDRGNLVDSLAMSHDHKMLPLDSRALYISLRAFRVLNLSVDIMSGLCLSTCACKHNQVPAGCLNAREVIIMPW